MQEHTNFNPTKENFDELNKKIEYGTENECRDALINFSGALAKLHGINLKVVFTEYGFFTGKRGDFALYGTDNTLPSQVDPTKSWIDAKMIVYELKNASCDIFDKKRVDGWILPSRDLIKAETQLLNYCNYLERTPQEIKDFMATNNIDVEMGGIIISKSYNDLRKSDKENKDHIIQGAIRKKILYQKNTNPALYTWENIIDIIKREYGFDN